MTASSADTNGPLRGPVPGVRQHGLALLCLRVAHGTTRMPCILYCNPWVHMECSMARRSVAASPAPRSGARVCNTQKCAFPPRAVFPRALTCLLISASHRLASHELWLIRYSI